MGTEGRGCDITEQDALARVLAGDQDAYASIVQQYRGHVFALALPIVKNRSDAEDVAQETFVRAYQKLATYHGGSLKSWLGQIAVNCAIDHWRKVQRRPTAPLEWAEKVPSPQSVSTEDRMTLQQLLTRLPTQQREAVELYYYQDLSYQEIAERLQVAERTVESTLYRARSFLRLEWQKGGSS